MEAVCLDQFADIGHEPYHWVCSKCGKKYTRFDVHITDNDGKVSTCCLAQLRRYRGDE
jgi:hypothetical protein